MSARWTIVSATVLSMFCCCLYPFMTVVEPLEVGSPAPEFSLPSLGGETVSLADYADQPLLLYFWNPY